MAHIYSTTLKLLNSSDRVQKIWIEPISEELLMLPGIAWTVVCESSVLPLEPIEVEINNDTLTIFGTSRGTTKIMYKEELVWEGHFDSTPQ